MNNSYSFQCSIGQRVTKSKKILSRTKSKNSKTILKCRIFKVNGKIIKPIKIYDDSIFFLSPIIINNGDYIENAKTVKDAILIRKTKKGYEYKIFFV